ncbi:MAG: S9 family peptidase [Gemmatimonadetes bacterium]|nr:S9 family peptidase [Gemmatimonadota bacterium]
MPLNHARRGVLRPAALLLLLASTGAARAQQAPGPEAYLGVKVPQSAAWSRDGRVIAYHVSSSFADEIRLYDVAARTTTVLLARPREDRELDGTTATGRYFGGEGLRWTPDGREVVFREGDTYFAVGRDGGAPRVLASAELLGDMAQLSPDQKWLSFIRDGDIWVQPVAGVAPRRLTTGQRFSVTDGTRFNRLFQWPPWSPDSRRIAFLTPAARGFAVGVVEVETGRVTRISPAEDIAGMVIGEWSPNGQRLAISRLSEDFRRKELLLGDVSGGTPRVLWTDTDDRWVDHNINPGFRVAWAPDGQRLAFLSNRTGWAHGYLASVAGGEPAPLTGGDYEVSSLSWLPGGDLLALTSQGDLHQRRPWRRPAAGGQATLLGSAPGVYDVVAHSPDASRLLVALSGPEEPPGLWLLDARTAGPPQRVYASLPEGMTDGDFARIEATRFTSPDGMTIPAVLMLPKGLDRSRRHPALITMYGGWGQQATLGWGAGLTHEFLQWLVRSGYVVMVVDPRGSEGYGAGLAKGLYREAGGKQSEDMVAAARHLSSLGYVESRAIALYGGSFSGWLTAQTMVHTPGVFGAGIAAAPSGWAIGDPRMHGTYWRIRLGAPGDTPDLTVERNPITHIDRLDAPLLVLHGTADINVPIAAAERLVRALIRAGKDFDYMVYPGEPHSWTRTDTKLDSFRRMKRFLDRALGIGAGVPRPRAAAGG